MATSTMLSTTSASSSTTSLTTVSSRVPLTGSSVQQKDFQAAFASLQSTYGFSGSAPSPVPKTRRNSGTESKRSSWAAAAAAAVTSSTTRTAAPAKPAKDFEAAFADLQATYGLSGSGAIRVPTPGAAPVAPPQRSSVNSETRRGPVASVFSKLSRAASPSRTKRQDNASGAIRQTKVRAVPRPAQHMVVL